MKTKRFNLAKILTLVMMLVLLPCAALFVACGGPEDGIEIRSSFKTTYYVGDALDVTGGIIDYTDDGKTIQVAITDEMISGFSTATEGTRDLVLTYEGYTETISYTVSIRPTFLMGNSLYRSVEKVDATFGTEATPMYTYYYLQINEDASAVCMFIDERSNVGLDNSHANSEGYTYEVENKQLNSTTGKYSCKLVDIYAHLYEEESDITLSNISSAGFDFAGKYVIVSGDNAGEYSVNWTFIKVA